MEQLPLAVAAVQRFPVSLATTASWELAERSIPVQLRNISAGGFCMQCPEIRDPGHRLLLHIGQPDGSSASIPAQVKWGASIEQDFLVGCTLLNSDDFHCLRGAIFVAEARGSEAETYRQRTA